MNQQFVLAPFAAKDSNSKGRVHAEQSSSTRSMFQRDRDRIVHSTAFRRLIYKTQVFMNHEGDLYRTRLTHSVEVAQVSRSIARALGLNEDLAESISLAHDLGHTPFGHAGQDALDDCMKPFGGFEHNLQSLRIVDQLEEAYPQFNGLNLTFESREGILKHCSAINAADLGDVGKRFLDRTEPSLEAQLTNLADEIAYANHDIDDGIRSELITFDQMMEVPLFARHATASKLAHPHISDRLMLRDVVRRIIGSQVNDLIENSRQLITKSGVTSIDDVRLAGRLIKFTDQMRAESTELKRYLRKNLYEHHSVARSRLKGKRVITELFQTFLTDPALLAPEYRHPSAAGVPEESTMALRARKVADYVAGMTDRYAYREHARLFSIDLNG